MDQPQTDHQKLIQAAGGILWRQANGGYEIAIVHRNRYDDWTLPKGKLRDGETRLQAALREVKEETGYTARVVDFAGAVSYETSNGIKVVCFWHMLPLGEPCSQLDDEVAQVVWLPVDAAHAKLQYPLEQALVALWRTHGEAVMMGVQPAPKSSQRPSGFRRWRNSIDASSSKRRLERDLALFGVELRSLAEKDAQRDAHAEWQSNSLQLLQQAEDNCKFGDIDEAWHVLKAARRWGLYGLFHQNKVLFDALALSIYREGTAKKIDSAWRKKVIKDLLSEDGNQFKTIDRDTDIAKVFWAQQVLDDYQDGAYEKMYILKRRLLFLNVAALLAIIAWILLAPGLKELQSVAGNMPFPVVWLVVVLSGVIGAVFSGFVRSFGDEAGKSRIPNQIAESYISFARLFVGAISAIGITTLLLSGLVNFGGVLSLGLVLAIAFISGFTEKLLQNAIDNSVSASQKPEKAAGEPGESDQEQGPEKSS